MAEPITILISTPLEAEHVERVRQVDPRITVLYEPDLLAQPRYHADHAGHKRSPEQEARFLELLAQANVTFDFDRQYLGQIRQVAPRLEWVQWTSSGIGKLIETNQLDQVGVIHTTVSGVHARPLADFCLMAMLMFVKDYFRMERGKQAKHWERYSGEELTGKTLAVIGLGRVGQEVVNHGKNQAMRVVGMKRTPGDVPNVDKVYPRAELHSMLAETDFLVLIAPHTPETEGIIGEAELAVMKPSAVLINIARATLTDEDALVRALQEKRLAGAALDVFRQEPLPPESPLWEMANVIVSPHSASTVTQENARITDVFCENLRHYLNGEPLQNVLDAKQLY